VLNNPVRLSQNSVRQAVAETIADLQAAKTDQEMADEWGVGKGTVLNARNRNHTICLEAFLRLGKEFGSEGVDTALSLAGLKAAPIDKMVLDVSSVPCDVAKCLPLLISLLADGDCSDADVRQLDDADVIDTLAKTAEGLKQRRDRMRLRSVA
jgi:hypothetical protein